MNRTGARLASAIVFKNQVVSYGVNQNKSHPFHSRFSDHDDAIFLHAETDAIKNALKRIEEEDLIKAIHYLENELEHTINTTAAGQGIPEGVPSANLEDRIPKVGTEGTNSGRVQRVLGGGRSTFST